MVKELQELGLSEKEAKVYFAMLELGHATADQLSKHAKIVRPTTYVQLKSLMDKGLVSTHEEGKKTYFAPESPALLKRLLEGQAEEVRRKERDLTELLPELLRSFESAGERPVVRFFPGKEGIIAAREDMLVANKEKKSYAIFSYEQLLAVFSKEELVAYTTRRKELGIFSRGIQVQSPHLEEAETSSLTERRYIPPESLMLTINLAIYDDKIGIWSLKGSLFAMIIQSESVASSMKSVFDFLWNHSQTQAELKKSKENE
jgi:sugar-specific transcriptional regulator TrmB